MHKQMNKTHRVHSDDNITLVFKKTIVLNGFSLDTEFKHILFYSSFFLRFVQRDPVGEFTDCCFRVLKSEG